MKDIIEFLQTEFGTNVLKVYEESHNTDGKVLGLKLTHEISLKWFELGTNFKYLYKYEDVSIIQEMLAQMGYADYDTIEIQKDFYIDCYDSEMKFQRPHIIFSLKELN